MGASGVSQRGEYRSAIRAARMFTPTSFEEPRQRLDTQFRIALTEHAFDDERGSDSGDLRSHAEQTRRR